MRLNVPNIKLTSQYFPSKDTHSVRKREKFMVNVSRTEGYKKSTIPYLQRKLNFYAEKLIEVRARAAKAGRRRMGQSL